MYTRKAIEKLPQFQNATENEKNGDKIENSVAKEQEIFTLSDGKMGMKFLRECTMEHHLIKQRRKNN